jgi:NADPH-dependent 2,4-dienoyl-CoA reductase/sulfur reductase-like enzyme/ferredoxin
VSKAAPRTLSVPLPRDAWFLARLLTVGGMLALAVTCWTAPKAGLPILWGLVVPALPLIWMLVPGLWRNVCPMASVNQLPRLTRLTRARTLPPWLERHGYAIGAATFFITVSLRPVLLQTSGPASAVMLVLALAAAFIGGTIFRGKSGFCGSVCPLRAPQAAYSRAPAATVAHAHCAPCVGCTTNCQDLTPKRSWLADLVMPDGRADARWLLSGLLPGFIVGFGITPVGTSYPVVVWYLLCWSLASLGLFTFIGTAARLDRGRLTSIAGAASLLLFYWWSTRAIADAIASLSGYDVGSAAIWEARGVVAALVATWLVRSWRLAAKETAPAVAAAPTGIGTTLGMALPIADAPTPAAAAEPITPRTHAPVRQGADLVPPVIAGNPPVRIPDRRSADRPQRQPTVTFWPEGAAAAAPPEDPTVSAAARQVGIALPEGCGSGLCGCDPIYVVSGGDGLVPAGEQERSTLSRLGLPDHARLACTARIVGDVVVSLSPTAAPAVDVEPERPEPAAAPTVAAPTPTAAAAPTASEAPAPAPVTAAGQAAAAAHAGTTAPTAPIASALVIAPAPASPLARVTTPPGPTDVERVVIIGNGVAGITAASHIRRLHPGCTIDLISRSPHPFYNRIAIARLIHRPQGLGGLQLMPDQWYDQQRITQWLNTSVASIDRDERTVLLGTGQELHYDRLIMATGAGWAKPPLPGLDLAGVFGVREAADAMRIRAYAQSSGVRCAAVLGGGLLGLEIAEALQKFGIEVTVIERGRRLAEHVLDEEASRLLRRSVEAAGITVRTNASVAALRGPRRLHDIVFEDGTASAFDMAVICVGITPDVELARNAGIETARGIVVDDHMRTSDPAVLACGDVAEHAGRVGGHWAIGATQAEVAAVTAVGGQRTFRPGPVPTVLKLDDLEVVSIGDVRGGGTITRVVEASGDDHYRVTFMDGDRPVGLVSVNGGTEADRAVDAIIQGHTLPEAERTASHDPAPAVLREIS